MMTENHPAHPSLPTALRTYAHDTAADTGLDYPASIRAMRAEPAEVARGLMLALRCEVSVEDVIAWCREQEA
jgi:hypothetical protein